MHEDGLIYRGSRLVNWDPALQTSLSDLEVVNKEKNVKLTSIKYKIDGTDQFITVATTRPETLLGDMAIAVHPMIKDTKNILVRMLSCHFVTEKFLLLQMIMWIWNLDQEQ